MAADNGPTKAAVYPTYRQEGFGSFYRRFTAGKFRGLKIKAIGPFLRKSGLKNEDLILKVQEQDIETEYELEYALARAYSYKGPVKAVLVRKGVLCEKTIRLPVLHSETLKHLR